MDKVVENNVLIIGGPNAGKTHFGGQLYGRLNNRQFRYKIDPQNRPSDLTIFRDVLDKLAEGKRADHTETSSNRTIELKIYDENNNKIIFALPDYGGEQIKSIIEHRRINEIWKEYLEISNSWMLFIRLDEVEPIEDIINRGIPSPEEIQRRKDDTPPIKVSAAAHFVELVQMFLHVKRVPTFHQVKHPNLTIVLSCWDILNLPEKTLPVDILKQRLPLFYNYLRNTWSEDSLSIMGLSSTEKTLTDEADEDYIEKTPINFGYIITPDGENEKDLTLTIKILIGK